MSQNQLGVCAFLFCYSFTVINLTFSTPKGAGRLQVQVGGGGGGCALLRKPMVLGAVFESDEDGGGDRLRLFVLESRVSFVVVQMSLSDRGGDRVDKIVLGICAMDKKTVCHACELRCHLLSARKVFWLRMVVPGNVNAPRQSSKPMKEIMNRIEKTSIFQARARARAAIEK